MAEMTKSYKIFVGKHEGKRALGECRRMEDNIKTELRDIGWAGVDWFQLDHW
jgi:hypothetical protein